MPNVLSWYHAIRTHVNMQDLCSRTTVSDTLMGKNHVSTSIHTVNPQFFQTTYNSDCFIFVCFIYVERENLNTELND